MSAPIVVNAVEEQLAYDLAVAEERIRSQEEDARTLRLLFRSMFTGITTVIAERDRLRRDLDDVRSEYADFRVRLLLGERASTALPPSVVKSASPDHVSGNGSTRQVASSKFTGDTGTSHEANA